MFETIYKNVTVYIFYLYTYTLYILCFNLFFVFLCFGHISTLQHLELSNVLNFTLFPPLWMYHKLCNQIPINGYETVSKFSVLQQYYCEYLRHRFLFACLGEWQIPVSEWNSKNVIAWYHHKKVLPIHFYKEFVTLYFSHHIINNTEYYPTFKISKTCKNSYFNCVFQIISLAESSASHLHFSCFEWPLCILKLDCWF